MIQLRTFGAIDLRDDSGGPILSVLAQPKRTALLACLALAAPRAGRQRDSILGVLWPDVPEERARHSLNQAVYALRRSLGTDAIVSCGDDQLALDPALLWCDAAAFDDAIACRDHERALELYRGPLLDGFILDDASRFMDWMEQERARFGRRALFSAWALADAAESAGNTAGAAAWTRRAGAIAADDELNLRRVVATLARLGDRAGALAAYEAFARRLAEEFDAAPSDATIELAATIRGSPVELPAPERSAASARAVPRGATPLIGREAERTYLGELLTRPDCRLVTVTGPGGIGKTRLAQEVAADLEAVFTDGVQLVRLAGLSAPEHLATAIVEALRLPPSAMNPAEQLEQELASRMVLLVLDNFDHLIDAAPLVAELLESTSLPKVLITSRQRLDVRAEWVVELAGLPTVAGESGSHESSASARVFLAAAERAAGRARTVEFTPASVAQICELVEGVPLALELAATWTRILSCEQIAAEIERSRQFLRSTLRDAPERHRSLWATFEQSWNMLDTAEQAVLLALAVFRGGFTRDAADAVAGARLEVLSGLVDKSMLRRTEAGRFEMLEALREFVLEKIGVEADGSAAELRHARHFAAYLNQHDSSLSSAAKDDALRAISAEIDNVRAAWSTACRERSVSVLGDAVASLFAFYDCRGWYSEARAAFGNAASALEDASSSADTARVHAAVLARQGAACWRLGEHELAHSLLERAVGQARIAGNRQEQAFALDRLAMLAYEAGAYADGERLVGQSFALRRELGDVKGIATSLNNLGSMAYAVGDYRTAARFCADSLALQRQTGDRAGAIISLQNLGFIALALGDTGEARQRLDDALVEARETGSRLLVARAHLNLGSLAVASGDTALARTHFTSAFDHALDAESDALAVDSLLGLAGALRDASDRESALALSALVTGHSAADAAVRARAERLADVLTAELAPDRAAYALALGPRITPANGVGGACRRRGRQVVRHTSGGGQGERSSASETRTYGMRAASFTSRTSSGVAASNRHMQRSSPGTNVLLM
jgi:predicted ATPase/DNA-binding SARP family transcriptional activator